MKYMGSKSRISNDIVPIIQKYIDDNNIKTYVEPFCGGCNIIIIDKIICDTKIAYDINPYLIDLLITTRDNAEDIPLHISEIEYQKVRKNKEKYTDWYVGLVGFCATFSAKFFGGYARGFKSDGVTPRDIPNESIRNLIKQSELLQNIKFEVKNYLDINCENCLIYCDHPYDNTTKYDFQKDFNHVEFWNWVRKVSKNNIVLISEQYAPNDFECIWKKNIQRTVNSNANNRKIKTEGLFKLI